MSYELFYGTLPPTSVVEADASFIQLVTYAEASNPDVGGPTVVDVPIIETTVSTT